jgi:predicted DNA-binding transcriptional regulator YafY
MTLEPRICEAINSMKVIEFDYADKVGNIHHRIVEPYAHGVQIGGTSESEVPGWKLFVVERMIGLIITGRTFTGTAPDYALGDKDLSPIYCRVS